MPGEGSRATPPILLPPHPWAGTALTVTAAMYGVDTSKPAGRAYYDSIAKLYAQWGVDYIKADDMCWAPSPPAAHSYHGDEIEALSGAIAKSGRAMVLSLSPDRTEVVHAQHVMRYCQ